MSMQTASSHNRHNPHNSQRTMLIYWMYAISLGHILVGLILAFCIHLPLFEDYHRMIESGFWPSTAPASARAQQVWWISLFGATIQNVGIWMAALIRLGELHRSRFAWLSLLLGIFIWAPQDIGISYAKGALIHIWVDLLALAIMIPPLLILAYKDKPS